MSDISQIMGKKKNKGLKRRTNSGSKQHREPLTGVLSAASKQQPSAKENAVKAPSSELKTQ